MVICIIFVISMIASDSMGHCERVYTPRRGVTQKKNRKQRSSNAGECTKTHTISCRNGIRLPSESKYCERITFGTSQNKELVVVLDRKVRRLPFDKS